MIVTYIIGSLALIIKPGPDLLCVLATAIASGKARAALFMAGLIAGCWLWILILSAGVASFFTDHPAVMLSIQSIGTAYIAYLAFCSFHEARQSFISSGSAGICGAEAKGWRLVGRGIIMAMSNPLTILFFLAFLPNFTRENSSLPPALQTLLLGTLFCALVPLIDLPVIFAAGFFRKRLLGSPKSSAFLKLTSAIMLACVAAVLAAGTVKDFAKYTNANTQGASIRP